jgi:hypothetical protein
MQKLILPLLTQVALFGIYFFLDARQMIAPEWKSVLKLGLNPLMILFYGLSVIPIWWSYRQFYAFFDNHFWITSLVQGLVLQTTYVIASYLGSRQVPTFREAIALGLMFVGILIAGKR